MDLLLLVEDGTPAHHLTVRLLDDVALPRDVLGVLVVLEDGPSRTVRCPVALHDVLVLGLRGLEVVGLDHFHRVRVPELATIGQKSAKVGNAAKPTPALQKQDAPKKGKGKGKAKAKALPQATAKGKGKAKAPPKPLQPELDSSDEEILEALALGAQGK